jgi:chromosome segregation ATPase
VKDKRSFPTFANDLRDQTNKHPSETLTKQRTMIRSLLKLGLLLLAGILVYNYFFGTSEEKENSRKIFGQIHGVVSSVGDLIQSEKHKFDAGKYDAALAKLGGAYKALRTQASRLDDKMLRRLDELEQRKAGIQQELDDIRASDEQLTAPSPAGKKKGAKAEKEKAEKAADQARRKAELLKELQQLVRDSDSLLQQLEK